MSDAMIDMVILLMFCLAVLTTPHPWVFVICAAGIWASLNFRLFVVFGLPHRKKRKK